MTVSEQAYPVTYRHQETERLADHLNHFNSVNLVGMKRVGINNFLHFFFENEEVKKKYLSTDKKRLFITIDLHDLIERDIFPFWTLTLKRLVDAIETSGIPEEVVQKAQKLFNESIQLKDLFVTVDSIRKILVAFVDCGYFVTLLFNRFDRMKEAATIEFFENLQSLKDHANRQLSYIFTSYRPLWELKPEVFTKQALSVFCSDMYLKPANHDDASIILATFEERYNLKLEGDVRDEFLSVTGGHVQFIHLSMLKLKETGTIPTTRPELIEFLLANEEALLQSEELLDSLTEKELASLSVLAKEDKTESIVADVPYLTQTGMVIMREDKPIVFSPLLRQALLRRGTQKQNGAADFTKKEHLMFTYLKSRVGELCEREEIIEAVWPEYSESGVSDWAVDRLVARVRNKLKSQQIAYEIITVITRGYKLIAKN